MIMRSSISAGDCRKLHVADRPCVQVCIFDDRIEILYPGMLYGGLDIATAKMDKSRCRNEAIAETFHYMHIIESWGTGIPRLYSSSALKVSSAEEK